MKAEGIKTFLKESLFEVFLPAVVLFVIAIFVVVNNFNNGYSAGSLCNKEEAEAFLKKNIVFPGIPWNPAVVSIRPIKLKNYTLCELVYENRPQREQDKRPLPRGIIYYGDGFFFLGQLFVEENGNYTNITAKKAEEVNKEFLEYYKKASEEVQKRDLEKQMKKDLSIKEFENLKSMSNVKLPAKNVKAEVVAFVDPYCPHCIRMKDVLLELNKEGKVGVYLIFTPISPMGEKVSASVICDKKTDNERLKAFSEKYQKEKPCDEGLSAIRKNVETFMKLGGRGVPYVVVKKGNEVQIIEGAVSKQVFESYIQ